VPTPDEKNGAERTAPDLLEAETASETLEGVPSVAQPPDTQEDAPAAVPVYDEARAESARDFVDDLLVKMGMEVDVDLLEPEPGDPAGEIRIEIEGRDSGRIIGKKGQVLAAIQHVVNRVVNRPGLDRVHVVVDAEGYRQRREDTLATMAQRLGKKALEEGKIITFEPMSPRDRRIVHLALAKFPGVVTKSDGEGEGRRVQIIPVRR
jgi:spoIIIJ-associated protein